MCRVAPPPSLYSMASLNLAAVLPQDSQERHHFVFFEQYTALEFAGYFDTDLWTRLILQMSRTQPAIRHAIVALGSLHENLQACDNIAHAPSTTIYSLQHYNKAVLHLQRQLSSSQQSIAVTLTCCLLFICFEALQRDYVTALTQLKKGLNILCNWKTAGRTALLSPEARFVRENLLPLYVHLDIQATTVLESRGLGFPSDIRKLASSSGGGGGGGESKLPPRFTSTHEARHWLDILLYRMYDTVVVKPTTTTTAAAAAAADASPQTDHLALAQLDAMSRDWATAFTAYLHAPLHLATLPRSSLRASTILQIHHTVAQIMIGTRLSSTDDALYASFHPSFKAITTLCASLIRSSSPSSSSSSSSFSSPLTAAAAERPRRSTFRFSLDMGVVPPLFYVAINCRDAVVRREAIALLAEEPRREGIWDGRVSAEVAREHARVKYADVGLGG